MNRDASPTRTIETERTLFRVSVKTQWLLLYFGACLECDVPIIEALFHSNTTRISPKGSNFKQRLIRSLWQHLCQSYPEWGPCIARRKGIFSPFDHRRLYIIEDEPFGVKLRGNGNFHSIFYLGVYVLEEEMWFTTGDTSSAPTAGQFFTVLDSRLQASLETLDK